MSLQMIYYHGQELFSPKYDRVFKALLLDNDGDYTFLASFLTAVLAREILPGNIISASSTELPTRHGDDKVIRLDIRARLMDGTIVNVEMQVGRDYSMGPRSVYQVSRLLAGSIDQSQEPEEIYPVIAINILDFDYIADGDGDGYHNCYRLKNVVTGAEMPGANILEVHYIELTRFPKNAGNSIVELWLKFITAKKQEDLEMITQESPVMASLVDKLVYASGTKELRLQMDDYKVNEVKNRLTRAYDRKEGKVEGRKEGILEVAKNLRAMGMNVEEVVRATGLTVDEVLREIEK